MVPIRYVGKIPNFYYFLKLPHAVLISFYWALSKASGNWTGNNNDTWKQQIIHCDIFSMVNNSSILLSISSIGLKWINK